MHAQPVSDRAHHARDQVDVDLREVDSAGPFVSAINFRRQVRAAVGSENLVVEVFDTETEPRNSDLF